MASCRTRSSCATTLTGPVGGLVIKVGSTPHPILETVRILLTDFGSASILQNLRGVRFTFDDTKTDEIFIGNIRFSTNSALDGAAAVALGALPTADTPIDTGTSTTDMNSISSMRSVTLANSQLGVDIQFTSNREFLPQGEMLVLQIGSAEFTTSRYPVTGETTMVTFTLTADEFATVSQGDPVVQYGSGQGAEAWNFGHLDKNMLK